VVLSAPAAVVFDLDGTLVLTEERNAQVWRRFLARYDVPLTPARLTAVTGRRGLDSLAELSAELPERFAGRSVAELALEVDAVEQETPLGEVREVPGARALVERLQQAGLPLALCTSATRPYALHCLEAIGVAGAFTAVVTAEDVRRGKPAPDGYLAACHGLGVAPAEAVGFEDSVAGVAAVVAAGLTCVAVLTHAPRSALAEAHAALDDLTQVDRLGWSLPTAPGA
jgi:HAD superfamily hydrolase (TIGR01509 family)